MPRQRDPGGRASRRPGTGCRRSSRRRVRPASRRCARRGRAAPRPVRRRFFPGGQVRLAQLAAPRVLGDERGGVGGGPARAVGLGLGGGERRGGLAGGVTGLLGLDAIGPSQLRFRSARSISLVSSVARSRAAAAVSSSASAWRATARSASSRPAPAVPRRRRAALRRWRCDRAALASGPGRLGAQPRDLGRRGLELLLPAAGRRRGGAAGRRAARPRAARSARRRARPS